ncbi:MAG: hypothetical protein AAGU19_17660 [Prolixibacteraceae bacterium]
MNGKNILFSLVLTTLMVITTTGFAHRGEAFIDDYKIAPKENFVPGEAFQQSWEITYGDSGRPVQVLLKETKDGEEYLIRTGYFEVKYVNGEKGFGVRSLKAAEQKVPESLNLKVLNSVMMNNQKMISSTKLEKAQVLEMIASYLPELINENYQSILN